MLVVAIDPGETTGFSFWRGGKETSRGKTDFDGTLTMLDDLLEGSDQITFVVEDYRHRKQHQGSRFVAVQVIGAVKLAALQLRAEVVLQRPDILRIAAMHAEVKLGSGHIPDEISAYLHGYWYHEERGLIVAEAQRVL